VTIYTNRINSDTNDTKPIKKPPICVINSAAKKNAKKIMRTKKMFFMTFPTIISRKSSKKIYNITKYFDLFLVNSTFIIIGITHR
jgi:hypothetical protein